MKRNSDRYRKFAASPDDDIADETSTTRLFAYDLAEYRDETRGFYFDFEAGAPGPLLATSGAVGDALQRLVDGDEVNLQPLRDRDQLRVHLVVLGHFVVQHMDFVCGVPAERVEHVEPATTTTAPTATSSTLPPTTTTTRPAPTSTTTRPPTSTTTAPAT
ncbi:MAG: CDP-glycerol glycerophosphotransferase family protein [Thermoplasmatota archaeon]